MPKIEELTPKGRSERARRERLRAAGLCVKCGKTPLVAGKAYCAICAENNRIRKRAYYEERKKAGAVLCEMKRQLAIKEAQQQDQKLLPPERCVGCIWGHKEGNVRFCMFHECLDVLNGEVENEKKRVKCIADTKSAGSDSQRRSCNTASLRTADAAKAASGICHWI